MINKIRTSSTILVLFSLVIFGCSTGSAQSNIRNKYGLNVVNDLKLFERESALDSNRQMLNIKRTIPGIVLDLKYATVNNFMRRRLYPPTRTTYLRRPAVSALKKVVSELRSKNLTIKILDAYRPYSITEIMWEAVKDSRYAADPSRGSGHNRGIAVDLILIYLNNKKELPMGTGFDNFSDTAHQDFTDLPSRILQNRLLLKTVMEKYGFESLETEWWHFSLPNANTYELLNISFDDLKKINKRIKN